MQRNVMTAHYRKVLTEANTVRDGLSVLSCVCDVVTLLYRAYENVWICHIILDSETTLSGNREIFATTDKALETAVYKAILRVLEVIKDVT